MFYLPWKQEQNREPQYQKRIYTIDGKKSPLSEASGIYSFGKACFSILTQKGTVQKFIQAIQKNADEEAKKFILPRLRERTDIEMIKEMFQDASQYLCYHNHKDKRTISVALGGKKEPIEVIYITMIQEHNPLGNWKICQIMKDGLINLI